MTNYEHFVLDLWMRPSKIFEEVNEEEGEEAQPEEEEEEGEGEEGKPKNRLRLKFDWKCKQGITLNIKKLCEEFNESRELLPNRIVFHGPPCSGKTYFAKLVAQHYNVPYIDMKQIIEECKKREDELGEEVRGYLDERKEVMVSEAREALERKKNQKKPNLPEDIDEEKIVPRLSDELIVKCIRQRL